MLTNKTNMANKAIEILKYSDPDQVFKLARAYGVTDIAISSRASKKYMIHTPASYLTRANGIHGNWRQDKFSPNNLSINLLW